MAQEHPRAHPRACSSLQEGGAILTPLVILAKVEGTIALGPAWQLKDLRDKCSPTNKK